MIGFSESLEQHIVLCPISNPMSGRQYQLTDVTFTRVADLFLEEIRKGGKPSIEGYANAFPHLSEEIRSEFPTLLMLERTVGPKKEQPIEFETDLGGCLISHEIGRGAMGVVYKAYQAELDRHVAVKVIPLEGVDTARIIERFELERRAMARLDHPNIVPVYNYGHDPTHAFLVMKYIEGESLDRLLDGHLDYRFQVLFSSLHDDWGTLATLGANVASGLQHAHEQGLIHRDIKPANLLLDRMGKVWITDFGLAKVYDYARSLSRTGEAIGTPRYMAPEQLRGICDPRSDVYSLGITLYELATKERAWNEKSLISLTAGRASLELPDVRECNPSIPEHLARIIMKACAFSPDDRYSSASELQVVLERFAVGATPSDRRRRKREPDEVFRKRSRRRVFVTLACLPPVLYATSVIASAYQAQKAKEVAAQTVPVLPVANRSTTFLEKLADAKEEDFGGVLTGFIRETVVESGDTLRLADDEKEMIVRQVDQVFERMRAKSNPNSKDFVESYQESSLPMATKIVSLMRLVENTNLSEREKVAAHTLLRNYARAVVNRHVSTEEANRVIAQLANGKVPKTSELNTLRISDRVMRGWLNDLHQRVASMPPEATREVNIEGELRKALAPPATPNHAVVP
jgi:tRNA A-37 threonylcarbamoyl transferase component Bud32